MQRKPIPLVPSEAAIDRAMAKRQGPHGPINCKFTPDAQRLYWLRDLMLTDRDVPVRVIGSVAADGKLRDLAGRPVRVFDLPPGGAA